jgi:hypothetical protein
MEQDSANLAYWYPILRETGVAVPLTQVVETEVRLSELLDDGTPEGFDSFVETLGGVADVMGYPAFLRTGYGAGKYDWQRTCFIPSRAVIAEHVKALVEWSETADVFGLPYQTWAVREFIPITSRFRAFHGNLPIGLERRFFVENGEVVCEHPYWPAALIEGHTESPHWRAFLEDVNNLGGHHTHLREQARRVSAAFKGRWSVDFALSKSGTWYAIDMAPADRSFHWPGCPHAISNILRVEPEVKPPLPLDPLDPYAPPKPKSYYPVSTSTGYDYYYPITTWATT